VFLSAIANTAAIIMSESSLDSRFDPAQEEDSIEQLLSRLLRPPDGRDSSTSVTVSVVPTPINAFVSAGAMSVRADMGSVVYIWTVRDGGFDASEVLSMSEYLGVSAVWLAARLDALGVALRRSATVLVSLLPHAVDRLRRGGE
jgi:hypothetical protein